MQIQKPLMILCLLLIYLTLTDFSFLILGLNIRNLIVNDFIELAKQNNKSEILENGFYLTDEEKKKRTQCIQEATKYAIEVPFKVMQLSFESMDLIKTMAIEGNPNSVSDAGVGALCARSAVMGAFMNVRINASGLDDKKFVDEIISKGKLIEKETIAAETEILSLVNEKIGI